MVPPRARDQRYDGVHMAGEVDVRPAFLRPVSLSRQGRGEHAMALLFQQRFHFPPALTAAPAAVDQDEGQLVRRLRSDEHTSELQSLMRISYAVFCLKK